ncbi:MAG: GNAT family N-acetyltransferase [Thermomicrobiales bacterium]
MTDQATVLRTSPPSAPETAIAVRIAETQDDFDAILEIRRRVFLEEQGIVEHRLSDGDDRGSLHVIALDRAEIVASGRITPPRGARGSAQIAWLATLPFHRGQGCGSAVLQRLVDLADERRHPSTLLSAQTHALTFYRRFGFRPYGHRFDVRGIEHQFMERIRRG